MEILNMKNHSRREKTSLYQKMVHRRKNSSSPQTLKNFYNFTFITYVTVNLLNRIK